MKYDATGPMRCFMTHSTWWNGAVENSKPIGILWHDTAAGNVNLKRYVQPYAGDANYDELMKVLGKNRYGNDWNHAARDAGVNAFIGKLADGTITTVQVGEWTMAPWGCGHGDLGSCNGYVYQGKSLIWVNRHWIQFEICDDKYKSKAYFDAIFEEACQLTAYLCKTFNIDPWGTVEFAGIKVPTILCHQDSYQYNLGSDHDDTLEWFKKFGKTFDDVKKRVEEILNPQPATVFHKGDLVKIIGSKYYSGKAVPKWVLKQNWYVRSAPEGSDRIVLGQNEARNNDLNSPFYAKDLLLVRPAPIVQVVEKGDLVRITGDKYYSGQTIPNWVLKENWYVSKAPSDTNRIVLGENEARNNELNTAVNRKDLQIIKKHN